MNGHGPDDSSTGELEEIVIRESKAHRPRRRSKEESPRSPARRYPKSNSRQADQNDNRPLLQHASSEPTSRLQFFALNHRIFQPHSQESRSLEDCDVMDNLGTPPPEDDGGPKPFEEGGFHKHSPSGLPPLRMAGSTISSDGAGSHPTSSNASFRHRTAPRSIPAGGIHTAQQMLSHLSKRSKNSEQYSDVSDLPDGAEFIQQPAENQISGASGDASGSGRGSEMASNGLTARQLLGKEEQIRSLMRGQSLESTHSTSLRSSLKGGRSKEPGGLGRVPNVVDLADINLGEQKPNTDGQLPFADVSSAVHNLAARDDPLPLPNMNSALRDVMDTRRRRVSWMEAGTAAEQATPVVDHLVAGDLHVGGDRHHHQNPPQTVFRINSNKSTKSHKDKDKDKQKGDLTPRSSDLQFEEDEEKDATKKAEDEAHKMHWWNFWKHYVFWARYMPVILTVILFVIGWSFFIWQRAVTVAYFEAWRWCFFLGCILPIYWISHLFVHCLVIAVESTLFTTKQVLYYTYGVRKPLARFLRVCMVLPVFVGCFSGRASDGAGVHSAYLVMTRLLGCSILFFFANVLATLTAKMMATHFHKEAHFKKMQEALQKEYYIMALSQQRADVKEITRKAGGTAPAEGGSPQKGSQGSGADREHPEAAKRSLHGHRYSGVYDKLVKGLPKMKKTGSLPDMIKAEEEAKQKAKEAGEVHIAVDYAKSPPRISQDPVPGPHIQQDSAGPQPLPQRESWQVPMQPFYGRASMTSQAPSLISRAAQKRDEENNSVAASQRTTSQAAGNSEKTKKSKFLLRTGAFKKNLPTATSVTNLTTALEGVVDTNNSKEFNGDLIKKLHVAEKHIRKNKLKVTFADQMRTAAHSEGEVASKQEAKRLAFYLFWNIKPYFDRNYILQEDIEYFLPPHKAVKAFELLDKDQDGRVSLHDIRDAILQIYKERKDLAFTLKDTKTIVGKLETIILVVVHVIFVMFYLLIFSVDVSKAWISFSSIVVAFSFIFGNSIRDIFMSVIFLFVVHPYDVGDGIMIGTDMHFVEEISLQNCVLKRWDGARVWYPNTVMQVAPVTNITRSGCKWENFIVYIDIGTPSEVFNLLNKKIEEHMEANSGELTGEFACCNFGCGDPMKIKLGVYFEYSHPGTDLGRLNIARHGLAMCICNTLYHLGVAYSMPQFNGPRQPGFGSAAGGEMSRPLVGSQAHTVVQQAATAQNAANMQQAAIRNQYHGTTTSQAADPVHPPYLQRFS